MSTSNLHRLPSMAPDISLSAQLQAVIMEGIQIGSLAPGERLLVDEVAAHFGVSKIPVREAFKALETSGWLESRPRRGTFVKQLSLQELKSIFELRRIIEPPSSALAAQRRTPEQLKHLEQLLSNGAKALKSNDFIAISRLNSEFHSVMAAAVGNELLSNLVTDLEFRLRRYFIAVDWQQRNESISQHTAIVDAIRTQNAELAEELTVAHIAHTESLAMASIELMKKLA